MPTIITFDNRSGRILGIHHGAATQERAVKSAQHRLKIDAEHIDVLTMNEVDLDQEKRYRVDVHRKTLVPAAPQEEGGVWFGWGSAGQNHAAGKGK
jgi:hypothetical protein